MILSAITFIYNPVTANKHEFEIFNRSLKPIHLIERWHMSILKPLPYLEANVKKVIECVSLSMIHFSASLGRAFVPV